MLRSVGEMDMGKICPLFGVSALVLSSVCNAALIDRGSGLLYDSVLNVTWLQDANYAKTSGYDSDGNMSKFATDQWIDGLVYHDTIRDVEYDDWRQ